MLAGFTDTARRAECSPVSSSLIPISSHARRTPTAATPPSSGVVAMDEPILSGADGHGPSKGLDGLRTRHLIVRAPLTTCPQLTGDIRAF